MTAQSYLSSTTKFVREAGSPSKNDNSRYSPPNTDRSIGKKGSERSISQNKQQPLKPAPSQTYKQEESQPRYGRNKQQKTQQSTTSIQITQNNKNQGYTANSQYNQARTEQNKSIKSIGGASQKAAEQEEAATPKTPFSRQPVNKNGRNLAFTNKNH